MTREQMLEVIAHPSMRALVRQIVLEELQGEHMAIMKDQRRHVVVPPGFITYKTACDIYGYTLQSIRVLVAKKKVEGAGGVVSIASMQQRMNNTGGGKQQRAA